MGRLTITRRTLILTCAAILSKLQRMVPQVALAILVLGSAILRSLRIKV